MRFRLRTLLIVLALGPPLLAIALFMLGQAFGAWFDAGWRADMEHRGF